MNRRRPSLSGSALEPQQGLVPVRRAGPSSLRFFFAGVSGLAVLSLALAFPAHAAAPNGAPSGGAPGSGPGGSGAGGVAPAGAWPAGVAPAGAWPGGVAPAGAWPGGVAPGFAAEPGPTAPSRPGAPGGEASEGEGTASGGGQPASLAHEQEDPTRTAAYDRYLGPARKVPTNPSGLFVVTGAVRGTRVASTGYQPFSENKAFSEAEVGAAVRVFRDEQKSLFAGAAIGWGAADSHARASSTHLESVRLEVTAQALYALRRHLLGTARLSVGALQQTARLTGESAVELTQTRWSPQGSAFVGLAARIPASRVDFLISLEGGWVFVPGNDVQLTSSSATSQKTIAPVSFDSLALGGPAIGLRGALVF